MELSRWKEVGRERRVVTDEDELEIVEGYQTKSALTLSLEWKVSRDTIWRILRDHNVTPRPRGRQPYDAN